MATYTMKDFINENIAVRVGQKHAHEFLKMCEKHDLEWFSGDSATKFVPERYKDELTIAFNCSNDGCLGFCYAGYYARKGWEVIEFSEIADNLPPRYQIIIECDSDVTTAKMTINGKETKVATAKRNPEDKFDWKTGASVAFERLWDKTPAKKDGEFKIGDRVVATSGVSGNENIVGVSGLIVTIYEGRCLPYGVCFDKDIRGHSCNGHAKDGHGFWMPSYALRHEDSAPKTEKVKEVKRTAKVGEYVKIVAPTGFTNEKYKKGDILKVVGLTGFGNAKLSCGGEVAIEDEYVVLEGYEPPKTEKPTEVKEVKRKAKMGEYIKITDKYMSNGLYEDGDIIKVKEFFCQSPESGKVMVRNPERPNEHWIQIMPSEYVVLEGYKPGMEV